MFEYYFEKYEPDVIEYKYKIMQLPTESDYKFRNYKFAMDHGFDILDYKKVYTGKEKANSIEDLLEKLWVKFNLNHPDDYKAHSLSVSDVIVVEENKRGRNDTFEYAHYCDTFGWKTYIGCINQNKH